MNAFVEGAGGGTPGFQPRIVPNSVANRNRDGPEKPSWLTTNREPPLNTAPVGAPGTFTTNGIAIPVPSYNVERSVPLSDTHQGVVGPDVSPHALTRFGSRFAAAPGTSETRFAT